jgi:hypothetical protein
MNAPAWSQLAVKPVPDLLFLQQPETCDHQTTTTGITAPVTDLATARIPG